MNHITIKALEGVIVILQGIVTSMRSEQVALPDAPIEIPVHTAPIKPVHGTQPANPKPVHGGQPANPAPDIPAPDVPVNTNPNRFEDDFSKYEIGQNLSGVNGYENAGRTDVAKLGNGQAMKMTVLRSDSNGGFGEWGFSRKTPSPVGRGQTIRFIGMFKFDKGFQWSTTGANLNKVMRFKRTQGGYIDLSISQNLDRMRVIVETENIWSQLPKGSLPPTGRLVEIIFEARLDNVSVDKGGMSEIKVSMDGKLLRRITNLTTLIDAGDKVTDFYMFTYWNNTVPQDQSVYLDSFVLESN